LPKTENHERAKHNFMKQFFISKLRREEVGFRLKKIKQKHITIHIFFYQNVEGKKKINNQDKSFQFFLAIDF